MNGGGGGSISFSFSHCANVGLSMALGLRISSCKWSVIFCHTVVGSFLNYFSELFLMKMTSLLRSFNKTQRAVRMCLVKSSWLNYNRMPSF